MRLRFLIIGLVALLGIGYAQAQGVHLDSRPRNSDNSDGCGQQRFAVELGRESMQRNRGYSEGQPWFQERLQSLQKCVDSLPQRRAAAAADRRTWEASKVSTQAAATNTMLWTFLFGLPCAIFLSYAQSAGLAGNAAHVRWRDWKGTPIFIWSALAVGALCASWSQSLQYSAGYGVRDFGSEGGALLLFVAWAATWGAAILLAWGFVLDGLGSTLKGIPMLMHYLFARHPAQTYLPSSATETIARRDFGRVMREHGVSLKSFWSELMTPSFVRRHHLERAAQVEAQLKADTSILKAAMERESARAAYLDTRSAS